MENICFFEGSHAEMNSTAVKNRFIARTAGERLVLCNKSYTDGNEIISILSENTFLDEYDVVVFGENVPENEEGYVSVMLAQDMIICGMVIKRKLLVQTGCFNEKLNALTDYEFLVRAAKYGNVFFVPVSVDDRMKENSGVYAGEGDGGADWKTAECETIAYVLRDNVSFLKAEGLLERVFAYFCKWAEQKGVPGELNRMTQQYLENDVLYERTAENTAPFFIISGDEICHGVLMRFADELAAHLVKCGQAVITTNHKYGNMDDFSSGRYRLLKGVIGFQAPALENEIFRKISAKKFQMWFDHPAFFNQMFQNLTDDYYILCQDMYNAQYLKKYVHVKNALQFPPAGIDAGFSGNQDRHYDVVFIGTYIPVADMEMNPFETEFTDYLKKNPGKTFEAALEEMLQKFGLSVREDEFRRYMCVLHPVCRNIINYFRHAAVETILKAGIRLDVFGDTWYQYKGGGAGNLVIHPAVSVEESLDIWGHSKVGLNVMSWHKGGMTERIANIMLSGAVCLSDETAYLREHFKEDEEIVLFGLDNLDALPVKINMLLENDAWRNELSRNAYQKAIKEHSWSRRAEQLLELCER